MIVTLCLSLILYVLTIVFMPSMFDIEMFIEIIPFLKILAIAMINWAPFYLFKVILNKCFPKAYEKIENLK
jgi:hypothetical protein